MDSWSFNSVVKGFASDESLSTVGNDQIGSLGCDVKPPYIFGNYKGLFPNEINIENQVFGDMGFPPLMKTSMFNPVMTSSQNAFSEENESNCGIDLKLGAQTFNPTKFSYNLVASEISMPSKKRRESGFGSSTPFCKVLGCNKNLSNCKEYHKRHKVCEVHSKTSKVIVNGIEQRFCQQCSRFHLLNEFDDGKRSCRKRLAGHNERRRKPHVGPFTEQNERLIPSHNISVQGNEFKRSTGGMSSFVIPYDHRIPYQQKYETNGKWQMNLEDRTAHDLQSINCITDERLNSKSLSPCNFETNPRFDGIVNGYIGASSSESAHSLLSYQSQQNTSCHSSRIQTSNSQSHHPAMLYHYQPNQDSLQLHQHGLNPMLGVEGSLVKFGIMNSDDQVFPDQGCTIDLLQLSSQLEKVEHQRKRKSQMNPENGAHVGLGIR